MRAGCVHAALVNPASLTELRGAEREALRHPGSSVSVL